MFATVSIWMCLLILSSQVYTTELLNISRINSLFLRWVVLQSLLHRSPPPYQSQAFLHFWVKSSVASPMIAEEKVSIWSLLPHCGWFHLQRGRKWRVRLEVVRCFDFSQIQCRQLSNCFGVCLGCHGWQELTRHWHLDLLSRNHVG